jgi:hypothetical protein
VAAGQAVEEGGVGGRHCAQFVPGEDLLQASPFGVWQAGGDSPEYLGDPREGVVMGRVLVGGGQAVVAGPDGPLDLLRGEGPAAEGAVGGREVLGGAEAVLAEHEGAVEVQQHDAEAVEGGCHSFTPG